MMILEPFQFSPCLYLILVDFKVKNQQKKMQSVEKFIDMQYENELKKLGKETMDMNWLEYCKKVINI